MRRAIAWLWSRIADAEAALARRLNRDQRPGDACNFCGRIIGHVACSTCGRPEYPAYRSPHR